MVIPERIVLLFYSRNTWGAEANWFSSKEKQLFKLSKILSAHLCLPQKVLGLLLFIKMQKNIFSEHLIWVGNGIGIRNAAVR